MTVPTAVDDADAWAVQASTLPVAFAQVREDPRLDLELALALPRGGSVVMIASGGDTAVCLGRLPLGRLHLVDMNPAQLALTRLKWHLAGHYTADEAAAWLGHAPMSVSERRDRLGELCRRLELSDDEFGPPDTVAEGGLDHAGRYERAFAELRLALRPHQRALDAVLRSRDPRDAARAVDPGSPLGDALDSAFARTLSLPNLVRLFGPEATQNPKRPFHEHFAWRTRCALAREAAWDNPFLWQFIAGRFPSRHRADWLQYDAGCGRPMAGLPHLHHGKMGDVLETLPPGSADIVHLSNILDWLDPQCAEETLKRTRRVLKPGGRVIVRQLNSTLDIDELAVDLAWDDALGQSMAARDRSFIYPRVWVGRRP